MFRNKRIYPPRKRQIKQKVILIDNSILDQKISDDISKLRRVISDMNIQNNEDDKKIIE